MSRAELESLGRRAVACAGWRWMDGMRLASAKWARVLVVDEHDMVAAEEGATEDDNYAVWISLGDGIPDLSDPATLGCLLALVREKWGSVYAKPEEDRWTVRGPTGHIVGQGPTEAEALVAALEASNG